MLAGIREILIISTPRNFRAFVIYSVTAPPRPTRIEYKKQAQPNGIAQAFVLGADFVGKSPVCLILGDNIFYGHEMSTMLEESAKLKSGSRLCLSGKRSRAWRYGVVEFDKSFKL